MPRNFGAFFCVLLKHSEFDNDANYLIGQNAARRNFVESLV